MLVRDIVEVNTQGSFRSDVQVTDFRNRTENLQLAESYIFTSSLAVSGREVGSVELLERLVRSYLPGTTTNRLEVIETFGHGKSHFAVAAATYFGRKTIDPSYQAILGTLTHAIKDTGRVNQLRVFREQRQPFLVILLRGDQPGDLPSKFIKALEAALADNEATRAIRPPFWFSEAESFLDGYAAEHRVQADAFLAKDELDLVSLRERVKERDDGAYSVCRELHRDLIGSYPDFQGAASLASLVEWAADELCGVNKPLGGVFILFDEFSTFIQTYGTQHRGFHASPLQDLLGGVQSRKERVSFVALAPVDSRTVAEHFGGNQLTNILKELGRIDDRVQLKSVLEDVLDSYLKQREHTWDQLALRDPLRVGIEAANALTFSVFRQRYEDQLKWTQKQLLDRVGYGCYPLHPMTTALFSSINFNTTTNPRSVLKFILDAVEQRSDQSVLLDGMLNWVAPVELVDYFQGMLDKETWPQFEEARRTLGGNMTLVEHRMIQAVFLITAGKVPSGGPGYARLAAEFASLPTAEADATLKELHQRSLLRFDDFSKTYSFWPVGGGAYQAEQLVLNHMKATPSVTAPVLAEGVAVLKKEGCLQDIEVDTKLGYLSDWAARQHVELISDLRNPGRLNELAAQLVLKPAMPTGPRSIVVWAVPVSDSDVEWARTNLVDSFNRAFGDALVPLVTMCPDRLNSSFNLFLRKAVAVNSINRDDIGRVGEAAFRHVRETTYSSLAQSLKEVQHDATPITARVFRGELAARKIVEPQQIVERIYALAFAQGPGEFSRHMLLRTVRLHRLPLPSLRR